MDNLTLVSVLDALDAPAAQENAFDAGIRITPGADVPTDYEHHKQDCRQWCVIA